MAIEAIGLSSKIVTVFGGSGFVGRHVVQALARRGYRVRPAVRRPDLAGFLQPLGMVGQVMPVQANLRFPWSVEKATEGASAVVNLVGILSAKGRQTFEAVQDAGARAVATAAAAHGARLVQISAIGADPNGATPYQRTKAAGEAAALAAGGTVVRPSVIFGPEDDFFNRFAALVRLVPVVPLIGDGVMRFQPVFVGDVAETIARAVDGTIAASRIYELGGPRVASLKEILTYVLQETGRSRPFVPLPFAAARIQAALMEFTDALTFGKLPPRPLMITRDQLRLLERDNLVSDAAKAEGRTLEGIGIAPTAYEAIVPSYLWRFRKYGQFEKTREA
ncbi:MAG: complex I NDUFA9 subunit family protein [Hyphomicrobiales bacterium]